MYKLIKNITTGEINVVEKIEDRSFIPFNLDCYEYQAYLAWLAEGNEPLPPDEPPT